jgi:hypothetical protein
VRSLRPRLQPGSGRGPIIDQEMAGAESGQGSRTIAGRRRAWCAAARFVAMGRLAPAGGIRAAVRRGGQAREPIEVLSTASTQFATSSRRCQGNEQEPIRLQVMEWSHVAETRTAALTARLVSRPPTRPSLVGLSLFSPRRAGGYGVELSGSLERARVARGEES